MTGAEYDLAVIGSGFGGALLASIARRLGRSVILIEKGRHPRFAIGESSTPLANLLWEDLCSRYDLAALRPLAKWGSWQKSYPQIGCGLKRGFSFLHHRAGERHRPNPAHDNQLLVAANPCDEVADTHWYRPDFDHFVVREAERAGVDFSDQTHLQEVQFRTDGCDLIGQRCGDSKTIRAKFVVDASGTRGFLQQALRLPDLPFEFLPPTQTLFSHFKGVGRLDSLGVLAAAEMAPYPIDDAAVHHVFEGGWIWVMRFNNGLVSAGVAAEHRFAEEVGLRRGGAAWTALIERFPTVAEQFRESSAVLPFEHRPQLSFRTGPVVGPNWALLPSAAGFVDPLLSTGFTLSLLGISRLAQIFSESWGQRTMQGKLLDYSRQTADDLLATERLVAALYATMPNFFLFSRIALLYFAAVSCAEIKGRMGERDLAGPFLLGENTSFSAEAEACCREAIALAKAGQVDRLKGREAALGDRVLRAIVPVDLIGLTNLERKNWYNAVHS